MLTQRQAIRDGVVVGGIGYAAVALFYSAFDFLAARGSFFTVDLLGKAVFRGLRDPAVLMFPSQPDVTAIVAYNALHFVLSLAIGLAVAGLVTYGERHPERARPVVGVLLAGLLVTIVVVGVLTAPMRELLPWWSIIAANVAATIVAGAYLVRRHPGIARRLLVPPSPSARVA